MKKLQNVAIIVSILAIGNYSHTSNIVQDTTTFEADLERYYGGPSSPRSYIPEAPISMESYIIANPYPNNYPGGPEGEYNPFNSPYQKYFQPADGSLSNGIYNVRAQTATTPLHTYKDIIIVDGTVKPPVLNSQAKYIDKKGNEYRIVGSLYQRSEDESDTFIYYFFGKLNDPKDYDADAKRAANVPLQTYDSQGE